MARRGLFILASAIAGCFSCVVQASESITPGKRAAFGSFNIPSFLPDGYYLSNAILGGRFALSNQWDVIAGLGMNYREAQASGGNLGETKTDTDKNVVASFGVRRNGDLRGKHRYFSELVLRPSVGKSRYWRQQVEYVDATTKALALSGGMGVEYFLHTSFSIEGKIGLSARYLKVEGDAQSYKSYSLESVSNLLTINWYF